MSPAGRKALRDAAASGHTRSFQGTNPPNPCYYSVWNDPDDAPELDGFIYSATYDCPSATWKFAVGTIDAWASSQLDFYGIWIDADENESTGCFGFEWQADGFWDPDTSQLLAGLFQTPNCDAAPTLATEIGVSRAGTNDITLTFSNFSLGNPNSIIWFSQLKSFNFTTADDMPDDTAVPNVHREDGFKGTACTGPVQSTDASPRSYAAVDDAPAAAAALHAEGQPDVHSSGAKKGVVRFSGDPHKGAEALAKHGIRATVTADHTLQFDKVPNDPSYSQQWALPQVKAPQAWDVTTGSSTVVVADLDSGVDEDHPDLVGKLAPGWDATTNAPLAANSDSIGHGTSTAGVIGAATDNSNQIASLGWQTMVMPVKVGDDLVFSSNEVAGIQWATDHGAKVINLSVGSECTDANEKTAVKYAQDHGVLVVASAGNSAQSGNHPEYPAALPGVLSVGATGANGAVTFYSNTGTYVDMVAPGGSADGNPADDVTLLKNDGTVRQAAGTSFSAPMVAAAAGLLFAVNPTLTANSVRALLINTATDLAPAGIDNSSGAGVLNAALAVQTAALRTKYNALPPARILDTRNGTAVGQGQTRMVQVTGVGGVPAGASAVALNVTATEPTAASYLTVFPSDGAKPLASNLNFGPGQTIPNMVVVRVGADGKVGLYNNAGSAHVIFDVVGWYGGTGDSYNSLSPSRILDTRNTGSGGAFGQGEQRSVQVTNVGGVPASNVSAVVLNVTVTEPTASSFLTVFPSGTARPTASNLNYTPGLTIPNLVVARVGNDGKVAVYNNAGSVHVIFDVVGWYGNATPGSSYAPLPPHRILDTRDATGDPGGAVGNGQQRAELVTGVGGVPASGVSAVVLNVTVTSPTSPSFLTVFPSGTTRPTASNLNYTPGQTIPNLVVARVGSDGKVAVYNNSGSVHVIFDVVGWFATPVA